VLFVAYAAVLEAYKRAADAKPINTGKGAAGDGLAPTTTLDASPAGNKRAAGRKPSTRGSEIAKWRTDKMPMDRIQTASEEPITLTLQVANDGTVIGSSGLKGMNGVKIGLALTVVGKEDDVVGCSMLKKHMGEEETIISSDNNGKSQPDV